MKHTYETKIKELEKEINDEKPEIDISKVFHYIFEKKGSSPSKETVEKIAYEFRVKSREKLVIYEGVFELLDYLKENNMMSILLSNAQRVFTMPELIELELDQKLDKIYLSSDIGAAKPSKTFFDYMLNKEELSAEECLFVGNDYIADIEGSRNVGMESIYIHTSCSPEIKKDFSCLHKVMDEDFKKVLHYIKENI